MEQPEKQAVREKHVLTPEQITRLLGILREPVGTMALVAVVAQQRATVEKLCEILLTNVDEKEQLAKELPVATQQIQ